MFSNFTEKTPMDKIIREISNKHREAFEDWTHGEPVKTWFDSEKNICIEYADGNWWHYNRNGEWW